MDGGHGELASINAIHGDGYNQSEPRKTSNETYQEGSEGAVDTSAGAVPKSVPQDRNPPHARKDPQPIRRRLPDERRAVVHHFSVGGTKGT